MTIDTRQAPGGRQRAQRPCFLFGAKDASAGAEYRGIRQRFPYRCNETKTSRTARRRSPWSPRRRHHQSLLQAKTTFVRISCTSCPLSIGRCWLPSRSIFGERTRASINRTSHHNRRGIRRIRRDRNDHKFTEHKNTSTSGGCSSPCTVHHQPKRQSTTTTLE